MSSRLTFEANVPYPRVGEILPDGFRQTRGSAVASPPGTTVRFDGIVEHRALDFPPIKPPDPAPLGLGKNGEETCRADDATTRGDGNAPLNCAPPHSRYRSPRRVVC